MTAQTDFSWVEERHEGLWGVRCHDCLGFWWRDVHESIILFTSEAEARKARERHDKHEHTEERR